MMSNSPNRKYDWANHLPNMIRLYMTGLSIPEICKEIQDEATGFTPGLSMVYNVFRSTGYPTERTQRDEFRKLNLSRQPVFGAIDNNSRTCRMLPPTTSVRNNGTYDVAPHQSNSSIIGADAPTSTTQGLGVRRISEHTDSPNEQYGAAHSAAFGSPTELESSSISNGLDLVMTGDHLPPWTAEAAQRQISFGGFQEATNSPQIAQSSIVDFNSFNIQAWSNNDTLSGFDGQQYDPPFLELEGPAGHHDYDAPAIAGDPNATQLPLLQESHSGMRDYSLGETTSTPQSSSTMGKTQLDIISTALSEDDNTSRPTSAREVEVLMDTTVDLAQDSHRGQITNSDNRGAFFRYGNTPSPVDNLSLGGCMVSRRTSKTRLGPRYLYNRSCTPEKCDSGYNSGRSSPLITLAEEGHAHLRSMTEFKGLYRVPCKLHEPQPLNLFYIPQSKDRYRDTPTCDRCLYSGIHNLAWSARYLKLEVFQLELQLNGFYDPTSLDAAGNSALHYAASGGAGFDQFAALIKVGCNPYQINTAGQLFLHCLRPYIKRPGSDAVDENLIALFNADLINLLNCFQPKGAFRWRDNEGRTVLDALASNITDAEMRAQTFRVVKDAGYPLEVSNQFPKSKSKPGASNNSSATNEVDFAVTQDRQEKAYQILGRASMGDPSYVDPDTGDNVLHALARLKLKERRGLLLKIEEFVAQDIDLNLHNREGDCPLAAFIRERPFLGRNNDETGATMSKYLDALLWKDARHRIPNKLNVNMRNREGATALYYAAIRARPDSVRSLIEAGANVNAQLDVDGHNISILQATMKAKAQAVHEKNELKIHQFDNVISYLHHENAVADPSLFEERAVCENTVRVMPM